VRQRFDTPADETSALIRQSQINGGSDFVEAQVVAAGRIAEAKVAGNDGKTYAGWGDAPAECSGNRPCAHNSGSRVQTQARQVEFAFVVYAK
jgi:hypothetical protein